MRTYWLITLSLFFSLFLNGCLQSQYTSKADQSVSTSWGSKLHRADNAYKEKRWADANHYYNEVLDLIDNAPSSTYISSSEIKEIHRKASYSLLLAAENNQGHSRALFNCSMLMRESVRGTNIDKHLIPVQFRFDSDRFTEGGKTTARKIAGCLNNLYSSKSSSRILLVGHTDKTGASSYNKGLSLKRAKALKIFIENQGIDANLMVDGKGEDEPLEIDSTDNYTQSEINALNRRVEVLIQ